MSLVSRKNDVPPQSKPNDWALVLIGDHFRFKNGLNKEKRYFGQGTPIVNYMDVYNNAYINLADIKGRVSLLPHEIRNFDVKRGDVLFTRTSETVDEIGVSCVVLDEVVDTVFSGFLLRGRPSSSRFDLSYCKYCFASEFVRKQIVSSASYTTRALTNGKILSSVLIPLPPTLKEQKAIATVLSDIDALISSLEKLIEKKKAIKQGVMQELLKPKDGWREVTLFYLADYKKENFDDGDWIESEYITDKGIRLVQTGNIGTGYFIDKAARKYISSESFIKLRCKKVEVGDLLLCRLAEPAGRACVFPDIGEQKVITSVDVTIFRPNEELANRHFLSYVFSTKTWLEQISGMSGGTTHKRVARGALGQAKIFIPRIEIQDEIAIVLGSIDSEIDSVSMKIDKMKLIKQGMMQELLNGKTRLI